MTAGGKETCQILVCNLQLFSIITNLTKFLISNKIEKKENKYIYIYFFNSYFYILSETRQSIQQCKNRKHVGFNMNKINN